MGFSCLVRSNFSWPFCFVQEDRVLGTPTVTVIFSPRSTCANSNSRSPILDLVMTRGSCGITSGISHPSILLSVCGYPYHAHYQPATVSYPQWDPQMTEHTPLSVPSLFKLVAIACHSCHTVHGFSTVLAHTPPLSCLPLS